MKKHALRITITAYCAFLENIKTEQCEDFKIEGQDINNIVFPYSFNWVLGEPEDIPETVLLELHDAVTGEVIYAHDLPTKDIYREDKFITFSLKNVTRKLDSYFCYGTIRVESNKVSESGDLGQVFARILYAEETYLRVVPLSPSEFEHYTLYDEVELDFGADRYSTRVFTDTDDDPTTVILQMGFETLGISDMRKWAKDEAKIQLRLLLGNEQRGLSEDEEERFIDLAREMEIELCPYPIYNSRFFFLLEQLRRHS